MPHSSFKIIPGVDTNKTEALNEAAISESQLVRFIPDRRLGGLVQKLGGWTRYFPNTLGSIIRALWAWKDTNDNSYLAVGAEGIPAGGGGALLVIEGGGVTDITPETTNVNVAVSVSTTVGSNIVTITDTGRNADAYDTVYIRTQISIGGVILFGQFPCIPLGANTYNIAIYNNLGEPWYATSTATGGSTSEFTTTSGSGFIDVLLENHGFLPGNTYPVLIATSVGGVTLYGNYIVTSVTDADNFVISGAQEATSTDTEFMNGGNANYFYYNGRGPLPAGTGFGIGGYGLGGYGTGSAPSSTAGTPINAEDWALDNWGEILIACPVGGPIYSWGPTAGDETALVIPEAPPVNEGCFVAMPQRQIVAWGSTQTGVKDPLLVRWCDVNNFNNWTALITNQAGSFRIPKGSSIVQAIQGPQQGLLWTDIAVWSMQYVGSPYVYQFNEIGTGCGLIGHRAAGAMNGVVYWMGYSQFFRMAGEGVEPIRCPVWDVIFQDIDTSETSKIRFAANSRFGEVAWYYPTTTSNGEVEKYVKYNVLLNEWDFGTLARTAWINESVLGPPIGAAPNQIVYQHETSPDADGQAMNSYFQTGYFAMTEADVKMFVDQIWPDMKWGYYGSDNQNATVRITFYVTDYPGATPLVYGPYDMTQGSTFITPRFRGRLVSIRLESDDIGSFWRLGNIRYRVTQDGKY